MRAITDPTPEVHRVFTCVRENGPMTSASILTFQRELQPFERKNRRAHPRYAFVTPLRYRAAGGALHPAWKTGRTVDMSAGGILIDIPEALPVGSRLELAMDWPGLYHGKAMVLLSLTASVVRVDLRGTAVQILNHEFREVCAVVTNPRRRERNLAFK
jgi:hypothetical protein